MTSRSPEQVIAEWSARGPQLDVPGASTTVWEEGSGEPVVCLHGVRSSSFLYRKGPAEPRRRRTAGHRARPARARARRPPGGLRLLVVRARGVDEGRGRRPGLRPLPPRRPRHRRADRLRARRPHPIAFERLIRLQGVATAVPAEELRAYVPLLRRGDGGAAFLRMMRGFERTAAFERRILTALAARSFPAQALWGEADPALCIEPDGEHVREALGVDAVVRLPGKHFVQEDAPAAIAEHVARLGASGGARD